MHLRADNNVIQLLLTILFCCVRDDVEEKIGENEQSELTLSLFPSSKQFSRWEEAPEQRECVPNSCLSHWQVRKLDTCLTRQSHGGRQKKQRNEHQINVHIIRTTVLFAFPNICSSHPQLIVAEQMILFLFIQTAKKQTLKVFDEELRLVIPKPEALQSKLEAKLLTLLWIGVKVLVKSSYMSLNTLLARGL